jgi:hypothetical protein
LRERGAHVGQIVTDENAAGELLNGRVRTPDSQNAGSDSRRFY